jgi:hypothetical protein
MIPKAAAGENKLQKDIHGYTQHSISKTKVVWILLYMQNQTVGEKWRRMQLQIAWIPTD